MLILFVATFSKTIGAGIAAYFTGLKPRDSLVVGVLMNTRGLVELIVLNLGLSHKILNVKVFTCMVIMALFTTFLTSPIVNFIYPKGFRSDERERAKDGEYNAVSASDKGDADYQLFARICLLVEKLEGLTNVLQICNLFAAEPTVTSVSITALELVLPTYTINDPVLATNEEGDVLQIESEADILDNMNRTQTQRRKTSIIKPQPYFEYQSIAQYASVSGCEKFNYARLSGNPLEFASAIKKYSVSGTCNMTLMQWRSILDNDERETFERLVWNVCAKATTPIVLTVPYAGPTNAVTGEQRVLASIKQVFVLLNVCDGGENRNTETVPLAVIPLIYKLAQKKHLNITVGITNDIKTRGSAAVATAVAEFISTVSPSSTAGAGSTSPKPNACTNVTIVHLPFGSTMYSEIRSEVVKTYNPELVVCGFTDASARVTQAAAGEVRGRTRTGSISEVWSAVVSTIAGDEESKDGVEMTFRRSFGVNNGMIVHPELGYLGQSFYESNIDNCKVAPNMQSLMVVHAPMAKNALEKGNISMN